MDRAALLAVRYKRPDVKRRPTPSPPSRQVGALVLRPALAGHAPEVLLVTSRDTGRWLIPKGWPITGHPDWEAAAIEAREEAGVVGKVDPEPVGGFDYFKRRERHFDLVSVTVYRLVDPVQLGAWKEEGQRRCEWVDIEVAIKRVQEPGLKVLLQQEAEGGCFCSPAATAHKGFRP